jgi:3-deoxy-manno-octulosonate cytidylyltransferase (CMP-KDO synthetase)
MKAVAIIPARMGSARFPGKPLARIHGRPMLQWVYEGTRGSRRLRDVCIATCDAEIREAASAFGAPVIMTSPRHERATERVAEAAERLDADVVVMVQGDEPMVVPDMVDRAIEPLAAGPVWCTNLAAPIGTEEEFRDPNTVKVVFGGGGDAMYFSRQPIPTCARYRPGLAFRQVCVIGFRGDFLGRYVRLSPTPAERAESIDMLRILEHGFPIRVVPTLHASHAVDTVADVETVRRLLQQAEAR